MTFRSHTRWLTVLATLVACRDDVVDGELDTDATSTMGGDGGGEDPAASISDTTAVPEDSTGEIVDDGSTGSAEPPCLETDDGGPASPSDCALGCEAHGFDVEHVSGTNYAARLVHVLSPACEGPMCPEPLPDGTYGTEPIVPCEQTAEALASPRGPGDYCKLAPISIAFGFDIGFTLPPVPGSITIERQSLQSPGASEPYVWRAGIVEVQGPATDYAGDWVHGIESAPDVVTRGRNLACIENLDTLGIPYDPDDLDIACASTFVANGATVPMRMRVSDVLRPSRGRLDSRTLSCDTPQTGVDTCCSACDHELAIAVAKYGADAVGGRRSPNAGNALLCDPEDDRLASCRDFIAHVDRDREPQAFRYEWDGCLREWALPRYDKVRETHPDLRPAGVEPEGAMCDDDASCMPGQECVGTDAAGDACKAGASCGDRRCIAEWFVECRADPLAIAAQAYCVDTRFRDPTAAACFTTAAAFEGVDGTAAAGSRLAECDGNGDGHATAAECCQPSLGDEDACDPFFQSGVSPIERHDRHPEYGSAAACACTEAGDEPASCGAIVASSCAEPVGNATGSGGGSEPGEYAWRTVVRQGGVRYDAELEGFELRIAAMGNLGRSLPERCAESTGLIGERNLDDGWRAHDDLVPNLDADFDRAMCSGSTYVLHFAGPDEPEHVVGEGGYTLEGKQRYVIETVDFLVTPDSGFPTDNLFIGPCASFSLRFSNRYDLSVDNQRKISIWLLEDQAGEWIPVQRIAGGRDCDPDATAGDVQLGAIPCLVVDVSNHAFGEIAVGVDSDRHGELLQPGLRYRIDAPGLDDPAQIDDPVAYAEAFHDVCGMPLLSGDLPEPEYTYDVTIDAACP